MLVKDERSSWYSRVGDSYYKFGIGEKKFYRAMDQKAWPNRTTPLQGAWSLPVSAMTDDWEQFNDLSICYAQFT